MRHNELLLPKPSNMNVGKGERIISVAAGILMLAKGLSSLHQKTVLSTTTIIAGSWMIARGISGHCSVNTLIGRNTARQTAQSNTRDTLVIRETMRVNRPRHEVYAYWRNLENLPVFMKHIKQVKQVDTKHSHWEAGIPMIPLSLEWDATIIQELANEMIAWRSNEGAMVENAGEVAFIELPDGGTEIRADISYRVPAGDAGRMIASTLNDTFEALIREDLQRFKTMLESQQLTLSAPESHAPLE